MVLIFHVPLVTRIFLSLRMSIVLPNVMANTFILLIVCMFKNKIDGGGEVEDGKEFTDTS